MKAARIDINEVFSKGGRESLDLLGYCIRSIQMDPVFIFLVRDYHNGPTVAKAVALYDVFCAPTALARLSTRAIIPPLDLRIQSAIRPIRDHWTRSQALKLSPAANVVPVLLPPRSLFDFIIDSLTEGSKCLAEVRRRYKPGRSSLKNPAGNKMTARQRHFVEKIWQPIIRPQLVAAGFWRIASIG